MKKVILFVFLAVAITLSAQEVQLTNGVYEQKVVVTADSVKAGTLYTRALEALSDWAGSQQRSKANVDVQDKDEGLVVYKGKLYLGYGKQNFMYGWDTFADFTLKVRCKDGRAQISVTVPSLTYYWTANNDEVTVPISEVLPTFQYKGKMLIKKASKALAPKVPQEVGIIIKTIGKRIANPVDDDF